MSQAHIEQFYSKAVKDPALINKMLAGTNGPDDFVRNAVKEGKDNGFDFSYDEANAWIKEQQRLKASGELSDSQLETVAGGKGASSVGSTISSGYNNYYNAPLNGSGNAFVTWASGPINTVSSGVTSAANSVAHFFSSW
jgi:predicted ribosomally synthesized peptide with nif11-like leader